LRGDLMIIRIKRDRKEHVDPFWGSQFIKAIPHEIEKINRSLGLELEYTVNQPRLVDGDPFIGETVIFMVKRRPWFLKDTYCLIGLYDSGTIKGYIGRLMDDEVKTIREVGRIADLEKGVFTLHKWLQGLIKASCEKI